LTIARRTKNPLDVTIECPHHANARHHGRAVEETATARYIASNVSTQLMLKTIIEIISTMADDPDKYRAALRVKLLELADTMPLAAMAPAREDKVRAFVRETIGTWLTSKPPN
jgi:hypothetical protein